MRHTPGPWKYKNVKKTYYDQLTGVPRIEEDHWINSDRESVALITTGKDKDTAIADAKLIAASPDLLAALEQLLNVMETPDKKVDTLVYYFDCNDFETAREAIAKAKGES